MSILYEVNLQVDAELIDAYDAWLKDHVAEMLSLPGFERATIFTNEADPTASPRIERVVHYWLRDRAAFTAYEREHAPRMRADGLQRFGTRASASRRLLIPAP